MAKAQPAPVITAATPVPHAPGVTYGQLCHVRRKHAGLLQPGTILARDGAWQRKAVVTHVVYGGSAAYGDGGTQHVFTVGLQALGNFYADGRMEPGPRPVYREVQVTTTTGLVGSYSLGGWAVVESTVPPAGPALLEHSKKGSYGAHHDQMQLAGHAGPTAEAMQADYAKYQADYKVKQEAKQTAKPKPAPESILDQFLIKDPFAAAAAQAQE
jgi:hypothetical protein